MEASNQPQTIIIKQKRGCLMSFLIFLLIVLLLIILAPFIFGVGILALLGSLIGLSTSDKTTNSRNESYDKIVYETELPQIRTIENKTFVFGEVVSGSKDNSNSNPTVDMGDWVFIGYIDETDVSKIHIGDNISLIIREISAENYEAKIEYIDPKGEEKSGAIQHQIKAVISKNTSNASIKSGYSANGEIILKRVKDALTVPESILVFVADSQFVYVENPQIADTKKYTKTYVKTGLSDGLYVEIKEGIKEGTPLRGAKKK